MVLDVSSFRYSHPGGTFLITQNVGRDISKFFYGGYCLENFTGQTPYYHSNIAKVVVNSLIVAQLDEKAPHAICKMIDKY